MADWTIERWVN